MSRSKNRPGVDKARKLWQDIQTLTKESIMQYLSHILAGVSLMAVAILTLHLHDTNILLDAKDARIERLTENVSYWKDASINHSNNATFQRERCDAFYDVVGDYIDVTNELKAQGWSDSVLPAPR